LLVVGGWWDRGANGLLLCLAVDFFLPPAFGKTINMLMEE
jgi:hypothetical protein